MRDLAILGAEPAFSEPLHVGRPNLGDRSRFMERVEDIFDRRWLTNNGPYVQGFERLVAERCGVRECIATCNGTIALELLIRGVGMEGEVIVPSYTFVATAHALQWQGIRPVFCDVDPATHTLDPGRVEELITPNTTGIVGVHLWGNACDTSALEALGRKHGIPVIFDASHAFGCRHEGRPIGGFGAGEVFSFHATKVLNCFEGGAILTDDQDLAERLRLMRNFGFESKDSVVYLGSNGKMSEVSAAMGMTSLESVDEFVSVNRRNFELYREGLRGLTGVRLLEPTHAEGFNYHYVVLEIEGAELTRDQMVKVLEAENVLARRYFFPGVHKMEPYRSLQPMAGLPLPETARLSDVVMTLPTGTSVEKPEIETITSIMRAALCRPEQVAEALASLSADA